MTSPLFRLLSDEQLDTLNNNNISIDPPVLIRTIDLHNRPCRLIIGYTKPKNTNKSTSKFISNTISKFLTYEQDIINLVSNMKSQYSLLTMDDILDILIPIVERHCNAISKIGGELDSYLQNMSIKKEFELLDNIDDYADVFPLARNKKRKITAYLGDTNSGKTWNALCKIADVSNSAYMAPLRLLAHETYEYLNGQGIPTSLVTGEEKIDIPDNRCTSSTVECFDPLREYDLIVIDEIQMIDDNDRGSFFVQALVGANASEIVVTGPPEYASRIQEIADYLGDDFELEIFSRKSELRSLKKPTKLSDIKPNTAIVAFSKKEVYNIQRQLPKHLKSTVLYGALGYDVRKTQAERFRNGEVDVIVTTDCIGMGLNLPIETVLFSDIKKYDGVSVKPLSVMLTKQIAGRAGRFGKYDVGYYGAIDSEKNGFVKQQLSKKLKPKSGLLSVLPPKRYIESLLLKYDLVDIMVSWGDDISFKREDTIFQPAILERQIQVAEVLQKRYDDYKKYWGIVYCPVDIDNQYPEFVNITDQIYKKGAVQLPNPSIDLMGQNAIEMFLKELNIYMWFCNKYPNAFPKDSMEQLLLLVDECNHHLNLYLNRLSK